MALLTLQTLILNCFKILFVIQTRFLNFIHVLLTLSLIINSIPKCIFYQTFTELLCSDTQLCLTLDIQNLISHFLNYLLLIIFD